jgi:cytochrome c oxidase subunit IV
MSQQGSQSAAATKQDTAEPPVTPLSHYLWVLAALLALLASSAGTAMIKLGTWNTVINLGIALMKALLVISVFMHETEARKLTRLTSALGFIWLAMLIGLTLFDFLTRSAVPSPWK